MGLSWFRINFHGSWEGACLAHVRAFEIEQINSLVMCSIGEKCMLKKIEMCKEAVCVASGTHGGPYVRTYHEFCGLLL